MSELEDQQIRVIADDLDLALQRICIEHRMAPLSVSAVALARLVHLNGAVGSKEDLGKLMLSIGNSILNNELDIPTGKNLH